jgi:TP901 family phage tail tape measure protein
VISIGTLFGLLTLKDEFSTTLQRATQQFSGAATTFDALSTKFSKAGSALIPLSVGVGAVGVGALKMATDLNESLANVSALLTDFSGAKLNAVVGEMKGKVQTMAVDFGKSTGDISGGLYEVISSLGYTNDTFGQLEISAKAGAAGLATTQEAFNFLSSTTKAYGDTSEAAFKKAADLGFQAVNFGQTTFPELAASIGSVAPIAKVAGVSMEEMFAVIATATGVTGNTSEVMTQMASAINALLNPSEELKVLFKDLGVVSGEALIAEYGFVGALQQVAAHAQKTGVPMTELLGRKEAFILTASLAGAQAGKFAESLGQMGQAAGANGKVIDDAFKKQTEGVNEAGFAWKQFKSDTQVALQQMGDVLLPIVRRAAENLRPLWEGVKTLSGWFAQLPGPVQTAGVALGAAAIAAGPFLLALGSMAGLAGVAASGLGLLASAASGLGVLAAGTTAVAALEARLLVLGTGTGPKAVLAAKALTVAYGVELRAAAIASALSLTGLEAALLRLGMGTGPAAVLAAKALVAAYSVQMAATTALTGATGLLSAAWTAASSSAVVMGVRMAAASAATAMATAAATLGSVAMYGMAAALLAVQYVLLPLLAVWAGWKLGPMIGDWLGFSDAIERASLRLQRFLGFIDKSTTDQDIFNAVAANTARRTGEVAGGFDAAADAAKRLRDEISGARVANDVDKLRVAFASLSEEQRQSTTVMDNVGKAALALREQGGRLHPELAALADRTKKLTEEQERANQATLAAAAASRDAHQRAAEHTKQVTEMVTSLREAGDGANVFTDAFKQLTDAERDNVHIGQQLRDGIDGLTAAGLPLAAGMREVYLKTLDTRQALLDKNVELLKSKGVTLELVDALRAAGLSEAEIAIKIGTTVEALNKHSEALTRNKTHVREVMAIWEEHFALVADGTQTAYQQAAQVIEKWYADVAQQMLDSTHLTDEQYNERYLAYEALYRKKYEVLKANTLANDEFTREHLLREARMAQAALDEALAGERRVSNERIIQLEDAAAQAARAAADWGNATVAAANQAAGALAQVANGYGQVAAAAGLTQAGGNVWTNNPLAANGATVVGQAAPHLSSWESTEDWRSRIYGSGTYRSSSQSSVSSAVDAILGTTPRRAMGGPVDAGATYWVGELGPELFVPRGAGTIVPNSGGRSSGGGTQTVVHTHAHLHLDGREIAESLTRVVV